MRAVLAIVALLVAAPAGHLAAGQAGGHDLDGRVRFGAVAVPGASVVATREGRTIAATTDEDGRYRLPSLAPGTWTIRVEMRGFAPAARDVDVPGDAAPLEWSLTLLPFAEMARNARIEVPAPSGEVTAPTSPPSSSPGAAAAAGSMPVPADSEPSGLAALANDGFLINGSVNNAAASPFAQLRAFGNNRPGQRSLYNWSFGTVAGTSAWDARPFSFSAAPARKPDYSDLHVMGTFGGPVRLPGVRTPATTFVGYQRTADHQATTQSARVPTAAERRGLLSAATIPETQISPAASALLELYPLPNDESAAGDNYQATTVRATTQHSAQARVAQPVNLRNQISGTFAFQHTTTDATTLFGFEDRTRVSGFEAAATWSHRVSPLLSFRLRYQATQLSTVVTPYFANRRDVSGDAGITGNSREPENWGPPALVFSNGVAGLADADFASTSTLTHTVGGDAYFARGRHSLTIGADLRRHGIDITSQQNPRGTFTFTGSVTGDPFGDFLLGFPAASAVAFGDHAKALRHFSSDAYISDDWRLSASFTVNAGVRWEYEAPIVERTGRFSNLDIAPGFAAAATVTGRSSTGAVTGRSYPASLLRPDRGGVQPRIGLAWRPVPGSSLVVRGGYGVYRNTNVYESIAGLLAAQPPFSTALSVETTPEQPLTLANGFAGGEGSALNTFAVDPDFRIGYAHNWQVSVQREVPMSLTVTATYLGTNGRRLMQQLLPNTEPLGAPDPCRACPSGFVYLTSGGRSNRHAAQLQVRRRLRAGFAASVQYTLARARDNAAAFGGATLAGASIAQDWTNLEAEYAPSTFDQRHLAAIQVEYTTGVGLAGGALMEGLKGRLFRNWTIAAQTTAGSGLPITPIYLRNVRGTGFSGALRPALSGVAETAPSGMYLNPAAYVTPAPGEWGNAGRNSMTGPAQFSLNAGLTRTFLLGDRLSLDWRLDATNVLNRVTYAGVDTVLGSPQFGRPNRANAMRKLQTTMRLRF